MNESFDLAILPTYFAVLLLIKASIFGMLEIEGCRRKIFNCIAGMSSFARRFVVSHFRYGSLDLNVRWHLS